MRRIELNRETGRQLAAGLKRSWRTLPELVLVRYRVAVELLLLVSALAIIGIMGARLIILPAELPAAAATPRIELRTAIIDELELWIEEREAQRQRGLPRVQNDMFVTSVLP